MKKLLTVTEASELLQIKTGTLYKYVCARRIPYIKLNGHLRFDEAVLNDWVIENSIKAIIADMRRAG